MSIRLSIQNDEMRAYDKKELIASIPASEASKFKKNDLRAVFEKAAEYIQAAYVERATDLAATPAWYFTLVDRSPGAPTETQTAETYIRGRAKPDIVTVTTPKVEYLDIVPYKDVRSLHSEEAYQRREELLLKHRSDYARRKVAQLPIPCK